MGFAQSRSLIYALQRGIAKRKQVKIGAVRYDARQILHGDVVHDSSLLVKVDLRAGVVARRFLLQVARLPLAEV